MEKEQRVPTSEEVDDWNDCSSSHNQHGSLGKYLKSTLLSTNEKLRSLLSQHMLLIFSNNNSKNDLEKEQEQPQTVNKEIEAKQYSVTLEDQEDSECTTGDIQVVSDPLFHIITRQPLLPKVKINKDVNNCENPMTTSPPESEPKADRANYGKKSTSCHPEGTSVSYVINNCRESSSIEQSSLSQEPDEDRGRGSFLTITSQIRFKLNYIFTLLFCSLLLTTSSAAQPVWDGVCHGSDLEKNKYFLFNDTELEYVEDLHTDEDKCWSFLEVEGILENMSYAYFVLGAIIVFLLWKVWHGLRTTPTNVPVVPLPPTNQPAWDDSDESDGDSFQSYFVPDFPVAVTTPQVYEHPLPDTSKKSASSQKYKPKRRNLSQTFPAPPQIETGVTKNTFKSPETDGEITFGLPLEASEFVSTETMDGASSPEETAAYDQYPPPAGIQESMDGHYSSSVMVSGKMTKVRDWSELNATPAVNVICALHPSLQPVTTDNILEFFVSTGSLLKTFNCTVELGLTVEPVIDAMEASDSNAPIIERCNYGLAVATRPFEATAGE